MTEKDEILSIFEDEAQTPVTGPSDAQIQSIVRLAAEQQDIERQLAELEEKKKDLDRRHYEVSTRLLPEAMKAAGVKEFTLSDGTVIGVEEKVYASISAKNEAEAFKWLEATNNGSIIKQSVVIEFARAKNSKEDSERQEQIRELQELLTAKGLDYAVKKGVHASTLKAFATEQVRAASGIPEKPFGIYQETVATVTKKK